MLSQVCLDLIRLYEETTGRDFKRDYYPRSKVTHAFLSDGARFVAQIALVLFPDATSANLNVAMKNASMRKAELTETSPK